MLQMHHVSTIYRRILFANVHHCVVGVLHRRCFPDGETTGRATPAPWLPLWGSWRAISEPERANAVANMRKCGDCSWVPSQSRLAPCQLSQRESQGAAAPPAGCTEIFALQIWPEGKSMRTRRRSRPWLPLWGSCRAIARLRGCTQWRIWNMCRDSCRVPSQSRLAPCQLSHRESQGAGAARPAQLASRCKFGGAAALGSHSGGAVER